VSTGRYIWTGVKALFFFSLAVFEASKLAEAEGPLWFLRLVMGASFLWAGVLNVLAIDREHREDAS
jgi:hypothetical protein